MQRPPIQLKRVYAAPSAEDGLRVLVDGLWPRGLSRRDAAENVPGVRRVEDRRLTWRELPSML
ncbi:MAG TPA: DUF488 family protein [Burkholderiales bacterium]|nr:DUF488 family protein [Burkholderiales bacterium]